MDSVAGGSRWRLTLDVLNCKIATLACPQLSDGECYTRRTSLSFPTRSLEWPTSATNCNTKLRNTLPANKRHGKRVQFNHIYLFIYLFICLFSRFNIPLRIRLLSNELFTIFKYTAERLVTAIHRGTFSLNEYYTKF